jgi:hypothetical protein
VKGRLTVGALGVLLAAYGVFRLLSQTKISHPRELAEWLAAAVVIHDGLVVPATMALGAAVSAFVPARARRYLQGSLVCAAVITVPALVLIRRRGTQPGVKALENQNYGAHLLAILAAVAMCGLLLYLLRVIRDQRSRRANERPPDDHVSAQV